MGMVGWERMGCWGGGGGGVFWVYVCGLSVKGLGKWSACGLCLGLCDGDGSV